MPGCSYFAIFASFLFLFFIFWFTWFCFICLLVLLSQVIADENPVLTKGQKLTIKDNRTMQIVFEYILSTVYMTTFIPIDIPLFCK